MRRAAKTDANQPAIVEAFRRLGASVLPLHAVGKGCPDLLIATRGGETFLAEIKDGDKPPSARKLTADQVVFHAVWRGRIEIVESVDDVIRIMGGQMMLLIEGARADYAWRKTDAVEICGDGTFPGEDELHVRDGLHIQEVWRAEADGYDEGFEAGYQEGLVAQLNALAPEVLAGLMDAL